MTGRTGSSDDRLARQVRTIAEATDLAAADLQAADWAATRTSDETLVAYLATAADYLRRAANVLDRLAWGFQAQYATAGVANTAGALIVLIVAAG